MLISHKHKFVYIAVPKTASVTIKKYLPKPDIQAHGDIRARIIPKNMIIPEDGMESLCSDHVKASFVQNLFELNNWDIKKYFVFASYRNPWDMVLSDYKYVMSRPSHPSRKLYTKPFTEHVKSWHYYKGFLFNRPNKTGYAETKNKKILTDFILRTETFEEDWNFICDKLKVKTRKPRITNSTKHEPYQTYYDEEAKNIINSTYNKEINYFNYTF